MKLFLLFNIFFCGLVILTKADNLTANETIYLQIHQPYQDTTDYSIDLVPIKQVDAKELLKQQVLKWQRERVIHIDEELPDFPSNDTLILLNGKKVKDLHQISYPKSVKYIKVLKDEQIPKRYRRKGIKSVIRIKTQKGKTDILN